MADATEAGAVNVSVDESKLRFRMVGDIGPLFAALAKASTSFGPIERSKTVEVRPKDSSKQPYKFSYAPLENLIHATRNPLADNELVVTQPYHSAPGGWLVRTILAHSSGAYIEAIDFIESRDGMSNPDLGGTLTFRRRYGYQSILGLNAEDDDDANAADGNAAVQVPRGNRGRGRQEKQSPASANGQTSAPSTRLALPAGWPNSEPPTIMRWIDALPENIPAWKWALAALKANEPLYNSTPDWPPVLTHFANRLRRLVVENKIDKTDEFCQTTMLAELQRREDMVAASSTQGTESHEPANQAQ